MIDKKLNPWLFWVMAGLFYLYEYILRVSPQVVMHHLMDQFQLDCTNFGLMTAFYYFAYVPMQTPCGYILDRLGVRLVITGSALFCAFGALVFTYTEHLYVAYLGRFLMGMGSACAYVGCMKVGTDWFESKKFPLIAGLTLMMGQIGASIGTHPFAALVYYFNYKMAMNILIVLGCFIAIAAYKLIPQRSSLQTSPIPLLKSLKTVMQSSNNWVLGLYGLFMYVAISGFAELWAIPFLMQKTNQYCHVIASLPIVFFVGVCFGSPIISKIGKQLNLPYTTMLCLGFLGAFFFYFVLYVTISLPLMILFLFLMGTLCGGHVLCFVAAKESTSAELSGTTLGFINMLVMTSGLLFQPIIGFLLDQHWAGFLNSKGLRVYSLENFEYALTTVFLAYITASILVILFFKKEIKSEYINLKYKR